MSSQESGWKADPSGRFELRYHDGMKWTEHVSTAGAQSTDVYVDPASAATATMSPPQQQWQQPGAPGAAGSQSGMNAVTADLKKQPPYFFAIAGGGIGLFLFAFFTWSSIDTSSTFFGVRSPGQIVEYTGTDIGIFGGSGTLILGLLLIAYSAIRVMKKESSLPPAVQQNLLYIVLGISGLALLISLIRALSPWSPVNGLDTSAGIGVWLTLIAAIAATAGAVLEYMNAKKKTA